MFDFVRNETPPLRHSTVRLVTLRTTYAKVSDRSEARLERRGDFNVGGMKKELDRVETLVDDSRVTQRMLGPAPACRINSPARKIDKVTVFSHRGVV